MPRSAARAAAISGGPRRGRTPRAARRDRRPSSARLARGAHASTNSAVDADTAIARSVYGASSRSATFWNHGRIGVIRVLVQHDRQAPASPPRSDRRSSRRSRAGAGRRPWCGRSPSAGRSASPGSNLPRVQVGDVDAELLERVFRRVLLAQAHERHVETRSRSKRGIIHANSRLTPCMRDPSHPRWSQTWTMFSGRMASVAICRATGYGSDYRACKDPSGLQPAACSP